VFDFVFAPAYVAKTVNSEDSELADVKDEVRDSRIDAVPAVGMVNACDAEASGPAHVASAVEEQADLGTMAQAAVAMTCKAKVLTDKLLCIGSSLAACLRVRDQRVGAELQAEFDEWTTPDFLEALVKKNAAMIDSVLQYVVVTWHVSVGETTASAAAPVADENAQSLARFKIDFCRLHNKLAGDNAVNFNANVPDMTDLAHEACSSLQNTVISFVFTYGTLKYRTIEKTFLDSCVKVICAVGVKVTSVHAPVIKGADAFNLLALVVEAPAWKTMVPQTPIVFDDAEPNHHTMRSASHNIALVHIEEFVSAVGLGRFVMPGVACVANGGPAALSSSDALMVLRTMCSVRDIATLAAIVQESLMNPGSEGRQVDASECFGYMADCVALLSFLVGDLEQVLEGEQALAIESAGWTVPLPFGLARQWRQCMAHYACRARDAILDQVVVHLDAEIIKCKAAVPDFQACVTKGKYDAALASEIVLGKKLQGTIAAHNDLHGLLTNISVAAKRMSVVPDLSDHDTTKHSVAIAIKALSRASAAAVVIAGAELLDASHTDATAVAKAKKFLAAHKTCKHDIPEAFWKELHSLVAHAAVAARPVGGSVKAVPTKSASVKGVTAKRELSPCQQSTSAGSTDVGASSSPGPAGSSHPRAPHQVQSPRTPHGATQASLKKIKRK